MITSMLRFHPWTCCTLSIWVTVPQKIVNVIVGQTANLQCTFTTNVPMTSLLVQWTLYPRASLTPEETQIGKQFQNRLTVHSMINTTKNASISISNMQTADAGTYTCDVRNFPDISGQAEASVTVNVLEKPSYPACAVHGDVSTGHLVTLTCHSSNGSPSPQYTWSRIEQGKKMNEPTLKVVPDSFHFSFCFACASSTLDVNTGTMYIRNISQFEFGTYQCNASNSVGFSTCTVELSSGTATIVGAVIGALLAVAFIVLLVWFITHKLKKQKQAEQKQNYNFCIALGCVSCVFYHGYIRSN
uniref:V-set and immunoglobulin domain-containing protein 1 n=1 Tax=Pygocentrus nattereri TaxID=42514 RepID=A0A3B4D6Y3_PYGNA